MSKRVLSDPSFESQNLHLDYFDCQEKSEVIDEIYSDPLNAEDPFYFLDLGQLKRNALLFKENFLPDDPNSVVAYAVKANPMPIILQTFVEQGIDCFDCASLGEISEVRKFLDHNNQILFNHPIKKAKDIKTAYSKYYVSHFTAQTSDEVDKTR